MGQMRRQEGGPSRTIPLVIDCEGVGDGVGTTSEGVEVVREGRSC